MKYELKPCPFCGGTNIEIRPNRIGDFFAICYSNDRTEMACYAKSGEDGCETEEGAVARWNTRPTETTLAARVAELEKALEWHPIATALKDGTEIQLKLKDQDSSITAFYDYSEEWPEYVWATLDGPRYPRAAFDAWANVPPFRSALKPKE